MNILLTGASGFVGGAVWQTLRQRRVMVRPVFRTPTSALTAGCPADEAVIVPTLDAATDWAQALAGVDVIIHCAARVHVMQDNAADPLTEYRRVNVEGTLYLAQQAAAAGVRRFVFISSIKVNGEGTQSGRPYSADDTPAPEDAYGISKAEAEAGLHKLAQEMGMELVIIRPVLTYGPGVKGNFLAMLRWIQRGFPLPLGAVVKNRRSLVALDNLVDLIYTCVDHPNAANQVFLVSDGEDLSTADLLQRLGRALDKKARLLAVPVWLLHLAARLLGKSAVAQRLLSSLQVDISKTRTLLGWQPPLSVDEGLEKLVEHQR
ncbi:Nucleoside-diphosphate-sugar epimerase [Nitrosomonas eutropha]|uniref:Nucleoside-diphosphate-sugar epimerase n=1 Tax=Nitrosomonas eutropha TaxID=916 RepID=A0A1I7I807_9PROT|nr:SDR family oxidoreductase [Nitrosomonas eutropha]SFU69079.1 Nucleoside-diphosphate-sugar epimerase [Nitrosomonas eutropha]